MLDREVEVLAVRRLAVRIQVLDLRGLKLRSADTERRCQLRFGHIVEGPGRYAVLQHAGNGNASRVNGPESQPQLLNNFAIVGVSVKNAKASPDHGVIGSEEPPGKSESRRKIQRIPVP